MINDVEFVCTGNNGRSPLAEIVAKNYIDHNGLNITVSSSGTMVDLPDDLSQFKGLVIKAVGKRILGSEYLDNFDTNPKEAIDELIAHEAEMRNLYISSELHLKPQAHTRNQIIARPEAQLILPIGENNLVKVQNFYGQSIYSPQIISLEEFSGCGSLRDPFPATYEEYRNTASRVRESTLIAIDKIVRMH